MNIVGHCSYPEDAYDRVWEDYREVFPELKNATVVQTSHSVRTSYDPEGVAGAMVRSEPPEVVMQTAVTDPRQISFSLNPVTEPLRGSNVYTTPSTISTWPLLYFAYFNKTPEEVDVFNFGCTGLFSVIGANVTGLPDPFLSVQYIDRDVVPSSLNYTTCSMVKSDPTMVDAIINAVEFFTSQDKAVVTTSLPDGTVYYMDTSTPSKFLCLSACLSWVAAALATNSCKDMRIHINWLLE